MYIRIITFLDSVVRKRRPNLGGWWVLFHKNKKKILNITTNIPILLRSGPPLGCFASSRRNLRLSIITVDLLRETASGKLPGENRRFCFFHGWLFCFRGEEEFAARAGDGYSRFEPFYSTPVPINYNKLCRTKRKGEEKNCVRPLINVRNSKIAMIVHFYAVQWTAYTLIIIGTHCFKI